MTPEEIAALSQPEANQSYAPPPGAPPPPAPPTPEQIAAAGNASIAPVNPGLPASVQPPQAVTPFDIGQANDPNISAKDLSPGAARARAIRDTIQGANARAAAIATGGTGDASKVSIAPPAPKPPEAGSTAGVTPIGPQPGAPGAGGVSAPTKIDPGFIAPRPTGGAGLGAAQKSALSQMAASDARQQAALGEAKDAAAGAAQGQQDLGFAAQSATANATEAAAAAGQKRDQLLDESAAREAAISKAAADRMAAIKSEPDPNRWWNNKSAGNKVLTGIGLALGTFGSAMTHSPNASLQLYQEGIAKDVEAQKDAIHNEWEKVSKGTELAKNEHAKAQWIDQRTREEQLFAYQKAQHTIAGYQAMATTDEQRAKLSQESAKLTAAQEQITQAGVARGLAAAQAAAAAGSGGGPTAKDLGAYRETAKEWDKLEAEGKLAPGARVGFQEWYNRSGLGRVTSTPGAPGAAPAVTPAVAAELAKKKAEKDQARADTGATVDAQANGLASTSVLEHPGDRLTGALGLQGTKGQDAELARDAWTAGAIADVHRLAGVRDPEKAREIAKPFIIQPGDTKATIDKKVQLRKAWSQSLSATPGGGPAAPGLPAGARED